jgi:hypothetical protein
VGRAIWRVGAEQCQRIHQRLGWYDPAAEYVGLENYPGPPNRAYRKSAIGGPPNESVEHFAYEAWEAFEVLRLYEALNNDASGPDLDTIWSFMPSRPQVGWGHQDGKLIYGVEWTTREREGSELRRGRAYRSAQDRASVLSDAPRG